LFAGEFVRTQIVAVRQPASVISAVVLLVGLAILVAVLRGTDACSKL
jgi:hypothetical protein